MTIALTAHIVFDPRRIRDNRWAHDMAHHIVCHRRLALDELADAERRRAAALPSPYQREGMSLRDGRRR